MNVRRGVGRDLLLLAAAFLVSLPLVTPRIYASDEVQYFAYLRSLWFDRDLSFENEYQHFYDTGVTGSALFHETFLERRTDATGLRVTFATIGPALLWSPFYGVADAIVAARRAMGSTVPRDGFSQPYVAAVAYGSAFYGWLAIVLGWWMARRVVGAAHAPAAAAAVWVGTPLFFYMYIAPPMSHACSAFAVAAFLAVWLRVRDRWSPAGCAALGALAALMAMVREQDAFIAIGPAVDWAAVMLGTEGSRLRAQGPGTEGGGLRAQGSEKRDWTAAIAQLASAGAAFLLVYAPQLWAYTVLNGYPGPSPLVGRKMNWMSPHALEVLLSPQHGLLFWTPLVVLSLAGLAALAWRADSRAVPATGLIARCLLLAFLSQVYVAGSVASWSVAGAFGQRRFLGLTAVFLVGLAALWSRARNVRARASLLATVAVATWWNLALIVQFGTGLMDRQRLELARNAYHAFVTIPARVPNLAYRYLFERRSFYQGSREP